jgi:mRNA-degrading endonuclease RelE of RelBE toxin-antitoxin system
VNGFSIELTKQAKSDLENLSIKLQRQISVDIGTLANNPFPQGSRIKKLKGFAFQLYRLRTGNFRILYRIDGNQVTLMRVIDRKLLDRILSRLT